MSRRLQTEAIVLKRKELLNKDIVYTLFTHNEGKIKATAKGIKSLTSKRSPHLQTGNLILCVLYKKDGFYYLQETNLKSGFSVIKKDSKKMSYLYFILFIIDRLLPENQIEEKIYESFKKFLVKLSKTESLKIKILEKYLSSLLMGLGYINKEKNLEELHVIIQDLINEKLTFHII